MEAWAVEFPPSQQDIVFEGKKKATALGRCSQKHIFSVKKERNKLLFDGKEVRGGDIEAY